MTASSDSESLSEQDAISLLRWQEEIGAGPAMEQAPVDRFAQSKKAAEIRESVARESASGGSASGESAASGSASVGSASSGSSPRVSFGGPIGSGRVPSGSARATATPPSGSSPSDSVDSDALRSAQSLASGSASLDALKDAMSSFEGCDLRLGARNLVFGDGNREARVMAIGEAPGRDEDLQALPFVGRSGQLLDRMLSAIGLDRDSVYITNVIPWRPPGNRTPTPAETELCRPFIERHIELIAPDFLILLGSPSAKTLLRRSEGIMRLRGHWAKASFDFGTLDALPTLHPAYLLRQPAHKALAWQDFLKIKARFKETKKA